MPIKQPELLARLEIARLSDFLFPVRARSAVFRWPSSWPRWRKRGKQGPIERDPQGKGAAWAARQRQLYKHAWVVYAKTPLGGPAQSLPPANAGVLEYLSRYTHRTAFGNQRIKTIDGQGVAFTARANEQDGKRLVRLAGPEFVRRFMLHILPTGFKRIRHYGVLANACKGKKLAKARAALAMPMPNLAALESATDFLRRVASSEALQCPQCKVGTLRVVQTLAGQRRLAAPPCAAPRAVCALAPALAWHRQMRRGASRGARPEQALGLRETRAARCLSRNAVHARARTMPVWIANETRKRP